jgi:Fe-S-cluster containining protein
MTPEQDCQQCGRCCEKWGWDQNGIPEDLIPWITQNRSDILQHVSVRFTDRTMRNGRDITLEDLPRITRIDYWTSPEGRKIRHCPFFFRTDDGKAWCRIHGAKPKVCTSFTPWNEGIRDYALNCPACRENSP